MKKVISVLSICLILILGYMIGDKEDVWHRMWCKANYHISRQKPDPDIGKDMPIGAVTWESESPLPDDSPSQLSWGHPPRRLKNDGHWDFGPTCSRSKK